jgi:phosphoribosylaminoimidazole-succinocarboxamide synthase
MSIQRGAMLLDGKAKQVFATNDDNLVWIRFKDSATAFDGAKKATIRDKGEVNARISEHLMSLVETHGIPTHMYDAISSRDHVCKRVDIIPIEVVVRNICAGSICRRFGIKEGTILPEPMVEFFYKDDSLHDPPISDVHALMFGWAKEWELAYLRQAALSINTILQSFWDDLNISLVDFKLEFGRYGPGRILLADEITPDGSRLWEKGTMRKLDKDVFRRDLGDLGDIYRELFMRIFGHDLCKDWSRS